MQPQEITSIDFIGGLLPGQLLIEGATLALESHCYGNTTAGTIIDSTWSHDGVKERKAPKRWKNYLWHERIALDFLTPLERQGLYAFVFSQAGKPYDKDWIWGYPFDRNWQDDDAWVCSELYAMGLVQVGVFKHIAQHRITPHQLLGSLKFIRELRSRTA